jgi:hypothetical protein
METPGRRVSGRDERLDLAFSQGEVGAQPEHGDA